MDDEGIDFGFVFDQPVHDVNDKGGRIDLVKQDIYYCEDDDRPRFPEISNGKIPGRRL